MIFSSGHKQVSVSFALNVADTSNDFGACLAVTVIGVCLRDFSIGP